MRWTPGASRNNIEDRRGMGGGGGMGGGFPVGPVGGLGGLVLLVLGLLFGGDILGGGGGTATSGGDVDPGTQAPGATGPRGGAPVNSSPEEEKEVDFVAYVLNNTQDVWRQVLPKQGVEYRDAKLVLFRDVVRSGCGTAQSAMGPFYCPLDEKVYVDLGFFDELRRRFGAPGDFAQAYVLAHEVGHHVQKVMGTSDRVRQMQERRPDAANQLSVRLELQADCYAGVWARSTNEQRLLQEGDIEEALGAASAVGDDRLQRQARGSVNPDSFTHGTSAQRQQWFQRGFENGDPRACDTFAGGV
jgi:predicted metalloprotease